MLLLAGDAGGGRATQVERAGVALDVRGESTEVPDRAAFRARLDLRRPPGGARPPCCARAGGSQAATTRRPRCGMHEIKFDGYRIQLHRGGA